MSKIKQIPVLFILLILLVPLLISATDSIEPIRVGYYDYPSFMSKTDIESPIGFATEYLHEVSKHAGWTYEYVDCDNWEIASAMLAQGEIDLLPVVRQTGDDPFLYPTLPMCHIFVSVYTRATDERLYYEDFSGMNGMRVAMVHGSTDAALFTEYAAENGISFIPTYYPTAVRAKEALTHGDVDMMAVTYLGRGNDLRCVAQFYTEPVYLAISTGRPDLLRTLNRALDALKLRDPGFESRLYTSYFSVGTSQNPVFTREEMQFIQNAKPVVAVYDESWTPLTYIDPETGLFGGIVADVFRQVEAQTGLTFEFMPSENFRLSLERSKQSDVDIICALPNSYLQNVEHELITTQDYVTAPIVLVSREGKNTFRRVAALTGYMAVPPSFPQVKDILYLDNPIDCFEALLLGQVDGVFLNSYVTDYLLSQDRYEDLMITTLTDYRQQICMGISKSADPRLFSILGKSLQYISTEQIDQIILNNTIRPHGMSIQALVRLYPAAVVGGIVTFFTILVLLLGILLLVKSNSNRRIERLLYRDGLTGLWNLTKFRREAEKRIQDSPAGTYALVYVDIKQFHSINDSRGFSEGDRILCALGRILQAFIREGEFCARVSADHFVLLLNNESEIHLAQRLDLIDQQLNAWGKAGQKTYRLVLIFGAYIAAESEQKDLSLMLDLASSARRGVTTAHKSHMGLYDATMRKSALYQRELSDRMQYAIEHDEFLVYFQPKVDMGTNQLVGSEALVRWNYPGRGILLPGAFVPYFEQIGFVLDLDFYVFEQVCKIMQRWMEEGRALLPVSCNFSTLHISDYTFPHRLSKMADRYHVPHCYLELEMTESVFMRDLEDFSHHFHLLKGMDFPISIDDFGSGYSSLGLLQRFAVDVVKLDRSFIQQGIRSPREQAVLQGIIGMAEDLHVSLICEGVETEEQARILQSLGCHVAQGWYYARPIPVLEFETLMDAACVIPLGNVPGTSDGL